MSSATNTLAGLKQDPVYLKLCAVLADLADAAIPDEEERQAVKEGNWALKSSLARHLGFIIYSNNQGQYGDFTSPHGAPKTLLMSHIARCIEDPETSDDIKDRFRAVSSDVIYGEYDF